jgi:malonyl-CoA decarboxylase
MRPSVESFRRKSVVGISRTWREIKGRARRTFKGGIHPDLPREDLDYLRAKMVECAEGRGGEASARARTEELGLIYKNLSMKGKRIFLRRLAQDFTVDVDSLVGILEELKDASGDILRLNLEHRLRTALDSPRLRILRHFNTLPDGFKFLVDMRADLLELGREDPYMESLEKDLKYLLRNWFDVGLLELQEMTWESPAVLLEKLILYEAVHEITSWADLKNRLDSDRRCFAFFHGKMPYEPLIFIEVALTRGMASTIHELLDASQEPVDPGNADTAVFYSISNTQKGLAGISLGNFLIKRVVGRLSEELPAVKTFVTLSPIPGFRKWLDAKLSGGDQSIFTAKEVLEINQLGPGENAADILSSILNGDWHTDPYTRGTLENVLMRLAALYLLREKKGRRAVDPVEHFHLSNGARVERVNWLADTSEKGLAQAAGMMVNYLYSLKDIDDNHEAYVSDGIIPAAKAVREHTRSN